MQNVYLPLFLLFNTCLLSAQLPGNVGPISSSSSSGLTAWFKADNLSTGNVSSWTTDRHRTSITLRDNSAPFPIATNTPVGNISNYNTTIDFTANPMDIGSNSGFSFESRTAALYNYSLPGHGLLSNNNPSSEGTMVTCYLLPQSISNNGHILNHIQGNTGIQFRNLSSTTSRIAIGSGLGTSNNATRNFDPTFRPTIVAYRGNRSNSTSMQASLNSGNITKNSSSQASGTNGLFIGAKQSNSQGSIAGTSPFEGYINEVIFYDKDLTDTELSKVYSYLAIKFGVTLSATPGSIAGQYLSSNGTLLWDASTAGAYHNDVIAIGRDGRSGLLQKQSHSYDDLARIYVSSLATNNASNTGNNASFGNNRAFVFLGHDSASIGSTAGALAEIPTGVSDRSEREWRVKKINFNATFSLDLEVDPALLSGYSMPNDLRLLIDNDNDFTNAAVYNSTHGLTFSVVGNHVRIENIPASMIANNSTAFLTVGVDQILLGGTVTKFDAQYYTSKDNLISWDVESSDNIVQFNIQRSTDGLNWEQIGTLSPKQKGDYQFIDHSPTKGQNYYRLETIKINTDIVYTEIKVLTNFNKESQKLSIHPNPATNFVRVQQTGIQASDISIYNTIGQVIIQNSIKQIDVNAIEIPVHNLPKGVYILKTLHQQTKFTVK